MAQWALIRPLPPAPSAASSLNLLLLLLLLPPLHHLPPRSQSPPIGRAAPLMDVHQSLLPLASRAPLFYLNNMMHGPSSVRGTLTSVTWLCLGSICLSVLFSHTLKHYITSTLTHQLSLLHVSVTDCPSGCAPQVQGGRIISSPERGRAGT